MIRAIMTNITETANEVWDVCKALKFDLIFSIAINLIIVMILFKLTDVFIAKLRKKGQDSDSKVLSGHLIPIFEKIVKFIILFISNNN